MGTTANAQRGEHGAYEQLVSHVEPERHTPRFESGAGARSGNQTAPERKVEKHMTSDTVRTPDTLVDENEGPDDQTCEKLRATIRSMVADWDRLNAYLNQTAIRNVWSSDYEDRLQWYNKLFKALRLKGRSDIDIDRRRYLGGQYPLPEGLVNALRERRDEP